MKNLASVKELRIFIPSMALLGIGLSLSSPYIALYCTSVIGMSTTAFGILMAISSLSGVGVNTLIARRSDAEIDRKWIIIIATLMSIFLYVSYLMVHNYFLLIICVAVFAGSSAPIMPQIFAYSRESIRFNKTIDSTFALSTVRSMFSLGFLIGPLVGTIVLAHAGYTGVLAGTAMVFLSIGLFVLLFLKRRPVRTGEAANEEQETSEGGIYVRKVFIAFVLLLVASMSYNLVTPLFIVHTLHAEPHDVGLVQSISAGLEIPIMLWLGALSTRVSNRVLVLYGIIVAIVYYVFLGFTSSIILIMIAQILQAIFVAVVFGNGLSYFQDMLPNAPGRAATLYANATSIGTLMGNLVGGTFAQVAGYRNVYWLCLVMVLVAFAVLALSKTSRASIPSMSANTTPIE